MTPPGVRQAYSLLADLYIDVVGAVEHVHPDDLDLIGRHLAGLPGPVLDLGCGPGHLTDHLRSLDVDASGIDLVPEFVAHARATYPGARFEVGSMLDLQRPPGSLAGVLTWYSLIHLEPGQVDGVLATIRHVLMPGGVLVVGFFDGPEVEPFEHRVVTAYRWPVDEMARRLTRAGFVEVERAQRPPDAATRRPHAAIAARAV